MHYFMRNKMFICNIFLVLIILFCNKCLATDINMNLQSTSSNIQNSNENYLSNSTNQTSNTDSTNQTSSTNFENQTTTITNASRNESEGFSTNSIINILLIVVGVVLILLGIAIFIRLR